MCTQRSRGVKREGFKQWLFQFRIVGKLNIHVYVAQFVVGDHFTGHIRMQDCVENSDGVFYRRGESVHGHRQRDNSINPAPYF